MWIQVIALEIVTEDLSSLDRLYAGEKYYRDNKFPGFILTSSGRASAHHVALIGTQLELVADILELVEEEQTNNPEEAGDYKDHHYQTAVYRALHLQ